MLSDEFDEPFPPSSTIIGIPKPPKFHDWPPTLNPRNISPDPPSSTRAEG